MDDSLNMYIDLDKTATTEEILSAMIRCFDCCDKMLVAHANSDDFSKRHHQYGTIFIEGEKYDISIELTSFNVGYKCFFVYVFGRSNEYQIAKTHNYDYTEEAARNVINKILNGVSSCKRFPSVRKFIREEKL